jgi:hypothetical protein
MALGAQIATYSSQNVRLSATIIRSVANEFPRPRSTARRRVTSRAA